MFGTGSNGTPNTGGGGGGSYGGNGGSGGSGIVIISYATGTLVATGGTISTSGGNTIHTFTASGTFTVTNPTPTFTALSTTAGVPGNNYNVTLTGTNFVSGTTAISISGAGVTASNVIVTSSTTMTATFSVASNAALGARNVTVKNNANESPAQTFSVLMPAPTLTSASPNAGAQGSSQTVTFTGTSFNGVTPTIVTGAGLSASNVSVTSGTSMTATIAVAPGATVGNSTLAVQTTSGTSATQSFSVTAAAPTLTSLSVTSGTPGNSYNVTLGGHYFHNGNFTVNASGANVSISNISVTNESTATATIAFASNAVPGARTITVTTTAGTSGAQTFTLGNPAAPTLTSISPSTGERGQNVAVVLTGTNLNASGMAVQVTGTNVSVIGATVNGGGTQITATFVVNSNASADSRAVTVVTAGGTSAAQTFTVTNPPAPSLTTVSPNSAPQGQTATVTLGGLNFTAGASVSVGGGTAGVAVSGVTVVSTTTITATFTVDAAATVGAKALTVSTPIGGTSSQAVYFTVTAPAAPASGYLTKYNNSLSLVASSVFEDVGKVGIGTATPGDSLDVMGNLRLSGTNGVATPKTIDFRQQGTTSKFNWRIGAQGNVNNGFEITPSTAADGATFTTPALSILSTGSVGVGTSAPAAKLHVAGDVKVDGNIAAKFQDVAEWVDAAHELTDGTVVVIDAAGSNRVLGSAEAYDIHVAGAVSSQPGIVLGERAAGRVLVAQSGRVRIKVDASYGPIRPGDLLVTSPTPGYAMKSVAVDVGGIAVHRPGTVLGKALESQLDGKGEILVLLTLQ